MLATAGTAAAAAAVLSDHGGSGGGGGSGRESNALIVRQLVRDWVIVEPALQSGELDVLMVVETGKSEAVKGWSRNVASGGRM